MTGGVSVRDVDVSTSIPFSQGKAPYVRTDSGAQKQQRAARRKLQGPRFMGAAVCSDSRHMHMADILRGYRHSSSSTPIRLS